MPKTRLSNEGILALSTGITDPGYRGRVSSILINFGKEPRELRQYAPFLRFTFHEIDVPRQFVDAPTTPPEQYLLDGRNMALQLPRTFLNLPDVTQDVARQVAERQRNFLTNLVGGSAAILAFLALLIAIITLLGSPFAGGNVASLSSMN